MDYRIWLFIITVLLLAGAIGFIEMLRQAKKLKIVSEEFFIDEEDRNNPVRIVFLSDIHISRLPIHWDYIGTMVSKQNPDLILLAGDLVYDPKDGPDALAFLECFAGLTDCPVYITYGNHDNKKSFEYDDEKKRLFTGKIESITPRFKVLENETVETEVRGRKFRICGAGDYRTSDRELALTNMPIKKDGFYSILVSHNPDILTFLPERCADLGLFGHYHNGQVHMPFHLEFKLFRRNDILANKGYIYGKYEYCGMPIYITSGVGNANMPIRFMADPEIVSIEL